MSSRISELFTSAPLPSDPSISPHNHTMYPVNEKAEPPPNPRVKTRTSKRNKHLRATLQAGHSIDYPSTSAALKSIRPKLTRLFISPLKADHSTNDENGTREQLPPLPSSPAIQNAELDTATLVSERYESSSTTCDHPNPVFGRRPIGRSEAIATRVQESLDEYFSPEDNEYRLWAHRRIVEWRRYRVRNNLASFRFGGYESHEFLVVKLKGQSETGAMFLRFERYLRDRSIDCARRRNSRPLYWQRWDPDDRVTMLDGWPDEHRYMRCEGQVFYRREHRLSLLDLLIAARLAIEAPWTDFLTRYDHWFAVLLGRMLNGRMERTHRLRQPVARGVDEK
ncbi:hypothetical protein C0995_016412 [Termitomyces sp. Mi166|nr:hypothetical protein C0995_016412 [Termitomyces sp. Mi166\